LTEAVGRNQQQARPASHWPRWHTLSLECKCDAVGGTPAPGGGGGCVVGWLGTGAFDACWVCGLACTPLCWAPSRAFTLAPPCGLILDRCASRALISCPSPKKVPPRRQVGSGDEPANGRRAFRLALKVRSRPTALQGSSMSIRLQRCTFLARFPFGAWHR
jgi:hypothetical protein